MGAKLMAAASQRLATTCLHLSSSGRCTYPVFSQIGLALIHEGREMYRQRFSLFGHKSTV